MTRRYCLYCNGVLHSYEPGPCCDEACQSYYDHEKETEMEDKLGGQPNLELEAENIQTLDDVLAPLRVKSSWEEQTGQPDDQMPEPDNVEMGAPRVRLKWTTPEGDDLLAHMARVSNPKANLGDPGAKLIGFLIRNHHWSPFEMVNMCLEIHTERDISAQILRHSKEFRFQEFSTRYAEVEDLRWYAECRFQDNKNKQASYDEMDPFIIGRLFGDDSLSADQVVSYWDALVNETRVRSLDGYRWALEHGVAKECARRILPFGLCPTVMYINSNIRGWIHYLAERTKPGVQKEHRQIALAVEPHFAEHFPQTWQAVLDMHHAEAVREHKIEEYDRIREMFREYNELNGGSGDLVDDLSDLVKDLIDG